MVIIIYSEDNYLRHYLNTVIDSLLKYRYSQIADLSPVIPNNMHELIDLVRANKEYLIIMAIQNNGKFCEILCNIKNTIKHCHFLFIGGGDTLCRMVIQHHLIVEDYLDEQHPDFEKNLKRSIKEILENSSIKFKGLFAKKDSLITFIHYPDIYYIETLKGLHLCRIVCKNDEAIIRDNIKTLINTLDNRFLLSRSSTIINTTHIQSVDFENKLIYFSKSVYCSFSQSKMTTLRNFLNKDKKK